MHDSRFVEFDGIDTINYNAQHATIPLWRILLLFVLIILVMMVAATAVCGLSAQCRESVPTLHTLLNYESSSALMVTALNAAHALHGILVAGLYYRTRRDTRRWSNAQLGSALVLYGMIAVSLFVWPYTKLDVYWINVALLACIALWMVCATFSIARLYKRKKRAWRRRYVPGNVVSCVLFVLSVGVYAVLRALPPADGIEQGVLAVEIFNMCAALAFFVLCMLHVWGVELSVDVTDPVVQ